MPARKRPEQLTCAGCLLLFAPAWRMAAEVNGVHSTVCPACSAIIGRVGGVVTDPDDK